MSDQCKSLRGDVAKSGPPGPVPVSAQVWLSGSGCGCAGVKVCGCESVGGIACVSLGKGFGLYVYANVVH